LATRDPAWAADITGLGEAEIIGQRDEMQIGNLGAGGAVGVDDDEFGAALFRAVAIWVITLI